MLRIHAQTSVEGAKSYYTEALAREDYYSQDQEIIGSWNGRAAKRLGLTGEVTRDDFIALCDNTNPATGERLTSRTKTNRRVGYDFNFHAPKSVSVVYSQTKDERILDAFRSAVNDTMVELEGDTKTRARASNQRVTTGNLVWGEFIHTTARPVDGVPDPHLHSHCFTFNATFDEAEDRWKAAEFGDIKRDARYFEAAFHARFARGLADQGFEIERNEKGWELAGIPGSVNEKFSRRTHEIEAKAASRGITNADQKAELGARTRQRKAKDLTGAELKDEWNSRLTEEERSAILAAGNEEPSTGGNGSAGLSSEAAVDYATEHEFARASVTSERKVLETALRRGVGEVTVDGVHEAASRSALLRREVDGRSMVSTENVLEEERAMLAFARDGRGAHAPLAADQEIQTTFLNDGQRSAVRHIWDSHDRVMMIRGGAGTGKTTLMREAARGLKENDRQVVVLAPTAEASRGVLRREGFFNAETVARFLGDEEMQARSRGGVLWIDEAGLLGTRDVGQVFQKADELECRVILCGDTKQHKAVSRGDALRLLETEAGVRPAEVTAIVRQKGSYKEAVDAIAKGDIEGGFKQLDALGGIREVEVHERHKVLADEYLAAVSDKKSALVVSPTHREGEEVTELIRDGLREQGRLRGGEFVVPRLKNSGWTEAERSDPARYQLGHVVQFHQHSGKARAGEKYRVVGTEHEVTLEHESGKQLTLPGEAARHFEVYASDFLPIAEGETLRITRNGKTADGKHRLNNGSMYNFKGYTESGDLELDNGWVLPRDFGHLAHGYVTTSHSSQGKTVDRVFIAQGSESFVASSREQFYVSVSRAREQATVFTDDKEGLREAVEESRERMSATELMKPEAEEVATTRYDRAKAHAIRMQQWAAGARDYASRQWDAAKETANEHLQQWDEPTQSQREPEPEPGL